MRAGAPLKEMESIDIAGRYSRFTPKQILPRFGANIEDLDLTQEMDDTTKTELYQALMDFEVLFFPPQEISPEQHTQLASCFGPLAKGSFFQRKEGAEAIEMIVFDRDTPPEINYWHTDLSWQKTPPLGSVIQITETPEVGGNTGFMSTSKAYDGLSAGMKAYLETLTGVHTWEVSGFYNLLESKGIDRLTEVMTAFRPTEHPVVITHPVSGRKAIYVNETFTREIKGEDVHFREARSILQFLLNWMQQPEFTINHQWEKNGLAVWDNRVTQHYALADYWPHRRVTQRVTMEQPEHEITASPAKIAGLA